MVGTRRARSVDELTLPEAEEIVLVDAEMRQLLVAIGQRQAGGGSKGGRYNKHDTARARFIKNKALVGLRLGILVPENDLRMLRLPPQGELRTAGGADWAAMETWAERHGRDPPSQRKDGALDEMEQLTLLNWVQRNSARFIEPNGAARGAPATFILLRDWHLRADGFRHLSRQALELST